MIGSLCQLCKKRPATTHLTEVAEDGSCAEFHICGSCIREHGLDIHGTPQSIAALEAKAAQPSPGVSTQESSAPQQITEDAGPSDGEPICPDCGLTWSAFVANNRFGCPKDAEVFGSRLITALDKIQGAGQHVGRRPTGSETLGSGPLAHRLALQEQLDEAVASEDFEEAARLRDLLSGTPP
jgi:protein arginine kinase activator